MATPPYTMGQSQWVSMVAQLKAANVQLAAAQAQLRAAQQSAQKRAQQSAQQSEVPVENNLQELVSDESDAADFLLYNSKYHDCFLTVGNPETDKVKSIGVTSGYLVANSPVFRKILASYKQADLPNANIIVSDIPPATFHLMLRYLYGGALPKMTAIETAGLVLCADKYKITRLVQEALKRLNPTSAEDVFPALICVTFTRLPDLEVQVSTIIQRETDKVVQSADFLQLDEACVIYMLKQDTLNIDEVELWEHVVRWAEHQVEIKPTKTVRDCLAKILGYVRLLTFTLEEIVDHVLPTEAVTPEEFVDLACAVRKKQHLKSNFLCNVQGKRYIYQEEEVNAQSTLGETENKTKDVASELQNRSQTTNLQTNDTSSLPKSIVYNKSRAVRACDFFELKSNSSLCRYSKLTIIPSESIQMGYFTCESLSGQPNKEYNYICNIKITKTVRNNNKKYKPEVCVEGSALYDDEIVLPLTFMSGQPIIMNPGEKWKFELKWNKSCPVYNLLAPGDSLGISDDVTISKPLKGKDMTVFYNTPFHVLRVSYKKP